nr:MAG TPA: hypothetical protein [Caudoviricetes sp.]
MRQQPAQSSRRKGISTRHFMRTSSPGSYRQREQKR